MYSAIPIKYSGRLCCVRARSRVLAIASRRAARVARFHFHFLFTERDSVGQKAVPENPGSAINGSMGLAPEAVSPVGLRACLAPSGAEVFLGRRFRLYGFLQRRFFRTSKPAANRGGSTALCGQDGSEEGGGRGADERRAGDTGLGIAIAPRLRSPFQCIVPYQQHTVEGTSAGSYDRSVTRMIRCTRTCVATRNCAQSRMYGRADAYTC